MKKHNKVFEEGGSTVVLLSIQEDRRSSVGVNCEKVVNLKEIHLADNHQPLPAK